MYYTRESAIPPDQAARLVGARTAQEKDALDTVLKEFFTKEEDGWHQKRCDEELEKYRQKSAKASESASARWAKAHSEGNANAMRTHSEGNANHKPVTNNQEPINTSARSRGAGKTAIPENWQVGETSIEYCKREFGLVPEAIERYRVAFVDACKAKDYRYKDFDSAFRNCVRQDWPQYRKGAKVQPLQAKKPDRFELANLEFEKRYGTPESVKALTEKLTRVA